MIFLWIVFLILIGLFRLFFISHTLDARLYYTEAEALGFFQNLSLEETRLYIKTELTDLCLIVSYSCFFYLSYQRLQISRIIRLKYFPFIPGTFDLIETLTVLHFLLTKNDFGQFAWLGYFTFAKWLSSLVVLWLIFIQPRLSPGNRHLRNQ